MANPSNQEQALYEMLQILSGDWIALLNFESWARMVTFGNLIGGLVGPWRTNPRQDITCINLFERHYLLNSLKVAMLKEAVGVGPQRYYIYFHHAPVFYSKLKLIMTYLPKEKMFLYPASARLEGPFLQEPWLSRGCAISSRPSLTLRSSMRTSLPLFLS